MRMILAIGNKNIEEKIYNAYYSCYEILRAKTGENVLNLVSKDEKVVVILREEIKGKYSLLELIDEIRQKCVNIQIIVFVKELTKKVKESLFSKEVFNIIEGNKFAFEDLVDMIENPRMIVYKENRNVKKSKVTIITGSFSVGKTTVALALGREIAKDKTKKVVVLDFDFIYPTLDTYLNITKNYSLVDYINDFVNNSLKEAINYESIDTKQKNLRYILNSKSIGIPKSELVTGILNHLEKIYDYIIVDTSTLMAEKMCQIAKDKKYNIILVVTPYEKDYKNFNADIGLLKKDELGCMSIICNKRGMFNLKVARRYGQILGTLNLNMRLILNSKSLNLKLRGNLKRVLRKIGVDRFENIKLKLVEKIINYKEEK